MKKRIAWWDNVRFILIILVVMGHFADNFTEKFDTYKSIFLFIYSFHMPLFIFISGNLHKNRNITEKCLFYVSVGFILKIILSLSYQAIGDQPFFSLLSDFYLPWYLFAMTGFVLLTYLLREQNKYYILIISILIACFTGFDSTIGDTLYLSRIVIFFPFYWVGSMINIEKLLHLKKRLWKKNIALAVIILWIFLCFTYIDDLYVLRHLFTGRNYFNDIIFEYGPLMRLLCYGISTLISVAVILIIPSHHIDGFSSMGERSLHVYFWHWPVFLILNYHLNINVIIYSGVLGEVTYLLLSIVLSIILSQKFVSYPLEWIRKLCYEKNIT